MAGHEATGDNGGIIWDRDPSMLLVLEQFQATLRTPSSPLIVSERQDGEQLHLDIPLPANTLRRDLLIARYKGR